MPAGKYNFELDHDEVLEKTFTWRDATRTPIPLATGWTPELKVVAPSGAVVLSLGSSQITLTDTVPNIIVTTSTTLPPGTYNWELDLTRNADSYKKHLLKGRIKVTL